MDFKIFRRIAQSPVVDRIALALAIVLLLFITTVLFKQIRDLEVSAEMVSHSLTVDKEINKLFTQYDLMESAEFRSVILKDSTFEASYIDHKLQNDRTFDRLYGLVKEMPYHRRNLDTVSKLKDSLHTTLTALHGKVKPMEADSTAMVYVERAASILKKLRGFKRNMLANNENFLQDKLVTYRRLTFLTPLTTLFLALFSIVMFTIAFFRLRRHKNKIQSSEALLQNIVQSTDNIMNYYEPIYDSNAKVVDFRVAFANICNRDYLNLEPDELLGKPITDVFPFVLKNNELQRMIDCFLENKTIDFERQVTVEGQQFWFHTFVRAMDGGILEVVRNNTEEYKAKENLLRANQELEVQNFIMSEAKKVAKIGSYTWYLDTGEAEISENYYRILGCEPNEFKPSLERYRSFVHPDDLKQYDEYGEWHRAKQEPRDHTYRIISKSGEVKHIRTKGQFIQKDGRTVMIGVVQDVSDQIAAENTLRIKNLELERSNVELESFNRVVSHDLQEPLRKIQMFISRIDGEEKNKLSERGRVYFDRIDKVAARMQSLIRNLLNYSRIDSTHDDFEVVDLNSVMKKVSEENAERIKGEDASIVWDNLPMVHGVGFQLEQLFGNLVSNSLKYRNPKVAPKIRVTSEMVANDQMPEEFLKHAKNYFKISLTDNGIGFDNVNAKKIFEVFQRLHSKTQYSGTGIGLAICKKIVENHHGFIHASGDKNRGSVFTIYLPVQSGTYSKTLSKSLFKSFLTLFPGISKSSITESKSCIKYFVAQQVIFTKQDFSLSISNRKQPKTQQAMKTISLKTAKIHQVFEQLQADFAGNLTHDAEEHILEIDNPLGQGLIKGISFKGGISYMEFDMEFTEDVMLVASSTQYTPICFAYCSQGQVSHSFGRKGEKHDLENFQTGILTSKTLQDNVLYFEKDMRLKMILVIVSPTKRTGNENHLNHELQKLFFKDNVVDNFAYIGSYNLKVAEKVRQINTVSVTGIARKLMIEGLVHLILALEIQQHSDDLKNATVQESSLTKKEREIVRELSVFINNYPEKQLSVAYLCKKGGLSPSKLQEGFKMMHGTTVTDYIRDVRVRLAENLIKTTDMNISEVVYSIGFISRSYFSKIFKAKYNCSPKEYKDKQRSFAISA